MTTDIHIKHLSTSTEIIHPNDKVSLIYSLFNNNPNQFGMCVVENRIPVGIVTSKDLALKLSGQFGYTLYQNKQISEIMDTEFLKVDLNMSVKEVSSIAMARPDNKLYDFIVVTYDDEYYGTVTIKDLLQKTTELEILSAKHQNPLTGLPGNMIIEQQIAQCFNDRKNRSIAYIDIDNFKAFNDYYGFEKGDLIIKMLGETIGIYFPDQFVGHIGGDDFVVVFDRLMGLKDFETLKRQFETDVLKFYNERDIKKGYIIVHNRQGVLDKFPLMTVTCVVTNNKSGSFMGSQDISERLADLKRKAKLNLI
ncbi:GGDEF domain-containing protein [Alkalibacter mobilis]|uniref:GGDEF domain-containing protein n=1 Tax=Alkalibacter mobilis TaxID=2787712 RepID=UPI00189DD16F|nr:GGDEF domain-containing protein [Alkalibacter mobilis]MBF7096652.1 GGDEF domain-containing protein [Alkalibacter mobilis]